MAIGNVNNKAWFEKMFLSVSEKGASEIQLMAFTNSFSTSGGSPEFSSLEVFGGKIPKAGSRGDWTLNFDGIPATTRDFDWIFHGVTASSTAITTSDSKDYRVTLLWSDETGITSAIQAIATSSEAYRRSYAECKCTQLDYNMDAGEHLTATMAFTLATEDETGGQNYQFEHSPTSSALTALSAYAAGTKF